MNPASSLLWFHVRAKGLGLTSLALIKDEISYVEQNGCSRSLVRQS